MNGDEVKIGSVFDGTSFIEKIPIWVRVDNVEATSHFYANYKLELRVEVIDSNGNILIGPDSDYLIYTLTKIQPEFVDETQTGKDRPLAVPMCELAVCLPH